MCAGRIDEILKSRSVAPTWTTPRHVVSVPTLTAEQPRLLAMGLYMLCSTPTSACSMENASASTAVSMPSSHRFMRSPSLTERAWPVRPPLFDEGILGMPMLKLLQAFDFIRLSYQIGIIPNPLSVCSVMMV